MKLKSECLPTPPWDGLRATAPGLWGVTSLFVLRPQPSGEKRRPGHGDSGGFAGHANLPDLVQQSHSPAGTPTEGLGRVSAHPQETDAGTEVGAGQEPQHLCSHWESLRPWFPQEGGFDKLPETCLVGVCGLPRWCNDKESTCHSGDAGSIPGSGRSPGEGSGSPFQYSCLENLHRQRSLAGYRPRGHKHLDMTEQLSTCNYLCVYSDGGSVRSRAVKSSQVAAEPIPVFTDEHTEAQRG